MKTTWRHCREKSVSLFNCTRVHSALVIVMLSVAASIIRRKNKQFVRIGYENTLSFTENLSIEFEEFAEILQLLYRSTSVFNSGML